MMYLFEGGVVARVIQTFINSMSTTPVQVEGGQLIKVILLQLRSKKIFIADVHDDLSKCRIFCKLTHHQGGPLQSIMQYGAMLKTGSQAKMSRYTDNLVFSNDVN
jgi:hypothetical protein